MLDYRCHGLTNVLEDALSFDFKLSEAMHKCCTISTNSYLSRGCNVLCKLFYLPHH